MHQIIIPLICAGTSVSAAQIPQIMLEHNVAYHTLSNVNWPADYPYCPKVEVAIAHDDENLLIHYRVDEQTVRAAADHDNGNVWEDSCVEFFCMPDPTDGIYYNIECNCAGILLIGAGPAKTSREHAPQSIMDLADRWTTLPHRTTFAERDIDGGWQLALCIPVKCLFKHDIKRLSDLGSLRINVYKCGDALKTPHFISLFPIDTPTPNFHVPQFFGEAKMK